MKIIACLKITPDDQDVSVGADGKLSFEKAEWQIGQYDLNAVEAAVQLGEGDGSNTAVLSVGPKELENNKMKKNILSRGIGEAYLVADDSLKDLDTYQTALMLSRAVQKIGGVDLVLCGEGSSDFYAKQVGIQLGELLNFSTINAVSKITVKADKLIVERELENDVEELEVSLPAVISVTTDINVPRIPGVKEILAASKKKVTQFSVDEIGGSVAPSIEVLSTLAPKQKDRKRLVVEDESEFLENFKKLL